MQIDINSDLGEGWGPYAMGDDERLLEVVSSANIACGFHAGDPVIMSNSVRNAVRLGVDVGAHPGFNDKAHFGRRKLPVNLTELRAEILYQVGALQAIAAVQGTKVSHLSFHGALGNMMYKDRDLAEAMVGAISELDKDIILPVVPNIETERAAHKFGLRTLRKFFSDREYGSDGLLVPRSVPNSVIHDNVRAAERIVQMLDSGTVRTIDGETITMRAQIVMVHGDNVGSFELARTIRSLVEKHGGKIVPMSKLAST